MVLDQYLEGELDIARLNQSLIRLMNEHLLINSNVQYSGDDICWHHRVMIGREEQVITYYSEGITEEELLKEVLTSFHLEEDLLIRVYVIRYAATQYRLIYTMSHIVIDGLSYDALLRKGSCYYNDENYADSVRPAEQAILYQELSTRLTDILSVHKTEMHSFWNSRLQGVSGLDLSFLKTDKEVSDTRLSLSEHHFQIEVSAMIKIKSLLRDHGLTSYIYGQLVLGSLSTGKGGLFG